MNSARLILSSALALVLSFGISRAATTPFDGTDWHALVIHDPAVKRDADLSRPPVFFYRADDGFEGVLTGDDQVVVGKAGGEWIAAVPLDTGGTIGLAGWLLYVPHRARHFGSVGGGDRLSFVHGRIVTVEEVGGRALNHGRERTYTVTGSKITLVGTRAVPLDP